MSAPAQDFETELRRAREALEAIETTLRDIVERNADGIVIVDHEGLVRFANPAAAILFGAPAGDLVGSLFGFPLVAGESAEIDVLRRGGEPAIAEMRVVETTWHGAPAYLASLRDVTERKRAEVALRRKEEQLRQAQRMETVGRLAAEVAHSINNVLMGVSGCGRVALLRMDPASPAYPFVEEIQKATAQGAQLMKQLVALSRRRALHPRPLDLNEVLSDLDPLLRRVVGDHIDVEIALDPALWPVLADPAQIEHVVMNLVVNSCDAMPDGGTIRIETRNALVAPGGAVEPGEYVRLSVRDDGVGMDQATRARIFEPLFTTKELGQGTGLGLSTVQAIVIEGGGHVSFESQLGRGTTFEIHLPRSRDAAPAERPAPAGPISGGTETVLLVDDEAPIRMSLRAALEAHGYRVLEAQGGVEAIAIAEAHVGPIHALLTDMRMPCMTGVEVARRVSAQRPALRVVYMTGYSGSAAARVRLAASGAALLEKPFTPEDLLRRLREVLDPGAAPASAPGSEPAAAPAPGAAPAPDSASARTVLLVDDQAATRIALSRLLAGPGRRVISVATAEEALGISREGARIDLLLTDVSLSGMTGTALAKELQAQRPGVQVIFMSGYRREALEDKFAMPRGVEFLEKPIDFDELEVLVDRALARAAGRAG